MHTDDLFTAPQVAKICSTDLKTIHNWVNRNEIKSFRTPGRHLRFRRQDILEFLNRFGYPIPEGFSVGQNRVVILDGDEASGKALKRALSRDFDVSVYSNHIDALLEIGRQNPNLVLVNADSDLDGVQVAELLATKEKIGAVAVFGAHLDGDKPAINPESVEFIPSIESREIHRRIKSLLNR